MLNRQLSARTATKSIQFVLSLRNPSTVNPRSPSTHKHLPCRVSRVRRPSSTSRSRKTCAQVTYWQANVSRYSHIHFLPFFATVLHFAGCSVRRLAVWLAQIAPSKHTENSSWVSPVPAGQGKDKRMAKVLNVHILPLFSFVPWHLCGSHVTWRVSGMPPPSALLLNHPKSARLLQLLHKHILRHDHAGFNKQK